MSTEYVSLAEVARLLEVDRATVYKWKARRGYNGFPVPSRVGQTVDGRGHEVSTELYSLHMVTKWRDEYAPRLGKPTYAAKSRKKVFANADSV